MDKIVLAFQGTGKTYFCSRHEGCVDHDFKLYPHKDGWLDEYISKIKEYLDDPEIKYVFCNISRELMTALSDENILFTAFAPINTEDGYEDVKHLLLGRMVDRKVQTPSNVGWIEKIKAHFDEWCEPEFFGYPGCNVVPVSLSVNSIQTLLEEEDGTE